MTGRKTNERGNNRPKKTKRWAETAKTKRKMVILIMDHGLAVAALEGHILLCCFIQFIY